MRRFYLYFFIACTAISCNKDGGTGPAPNPVAISLNTIRINGQAATSVNFNINTTPVIKFNFTGPVDRNSLVGSLIFRNKLGADIAYTSSYENHDSTVVLQPSASL